MAELRSTPVIAARPVINFSHLHYAYKCFCAIPRIHKRSHFTPRWDTSLLQQHKGWRLSPTTQDFSAPSQQHLPPHTRFAFLYTPCKTLAVQYREAIYPKVEGNARKVLPRLQLCCVLQQRMRPISCKTIVFFLMCSSGSRKITFFSVLFPFSLVHLSAPLVIWLKAFKELIWDSRRDKEAPAERMTATLCCVLALFAVSYSSWRSDQSHLHSAGFESICGNSYAAKCAHLTLHRSDTKAICEQYRTDLRG